jgi:hypothetical protein
MHVDEVEQNGQPGNHGCNQQKSAKALHRVGITVVKTLPHSGAVLRLPVSVDVRAVCWSLTVQGLKPCGQAHGRRFREWWLLFSLDGH